MKKNLIALVASVAMVMGLVACTNAGADNNTTAAVPVAETTVADTTTAAAETTVADATSKVMSYEEFVAADLDTEVTVVAYVQAKESWWDNKATVYVAAEDGAYLLYELPCSEEEYATLTVGTKLEVTGFKAEWSGEVEIIDAQFSVFTDDTYVAEATEIAAADFADHLNQFVAVKNLTVVASVVDGKEVGSMYDWDGSGEAGKASVYFTLSDGTTEYVFNVRNYLSGTDSDVYKAAEALEVGATVDVECFVYWYGDAAQPRVTSINVQ